MQHGYIPQGRAANAMMALGILPPPELPNELLWDLLTDLGAQWFEHDTEHPPFNQAKIDVMNAASRIQRRRAG